VQSLLFRSGTFAGIFTGSGGRILTSRWMLSKTAELAELPIPDSRILSERRPIFMTTYIHPFTRLDSVFGNGSLRADRPVLPF